MLSSISSFGFQQVPTSYSSSPTPTIISSGQDDNTKEQSPVPSDNQQKVPATVTGQESQSNRKNTEGDSPKDQDKVSDKKLASSSPTDLTEEEVKIVKELQKRDREVRAHEAAHLAVAGQHARGRVNLELTRGPDGRSYAIGGSVNIDTRPESTPEATIRKADQIKRAALAPAEPSGQDRAIAAEATQMKLEAQAELAKIRMEESKPDPAIKADETETDTSSEPTEAPSPAKETQTCAVCGGGHPTGPHLESNQRKTEQYISSVSGLEPQLNRVA